MATCDIDGASRGRKHRVVQLSKENAKDIAALYKAVWLKAYDYPKEWREKRAISEAEVKKEMDAGYFFFGVHVKNELVGVYKVTLTERGCYGEQQAVLPEYQNQGVAYAMYEQFLEFAKVNKCRVNYVNILVGNEPCERAMKRYNFYKTGEPWEQSKGMLVQTYERKVEEGV
ncbi:MAG TPA: GNAT family N-acetyltransferase [Candidatus Bathyarchaeia archaeon]|nr:GNAT family N-acetyltransferase [Candidatus Bathyarchaeia archaeon]